MEYSQCSTLPGAFPGSYRVPGWFPVGDPTAVTPLRVSLWTPWLCRKDEEAAGARSVITNARR